MITLKQSREIEKMNKVVALELDNGEFFQVEYRSFVEFSWNEFNTPEKARELIETLIPAVSTTSLVSTGKNLIGKFNEINDVLVLSRIDEENWIWLKKERRNVFVPL